MLAGHANCYLTDGRALLMCRPAVRFPCVRSRCGSSHHRHSASPLSPWRGTTLRADCLRAARLVHRRAPHCIDPYVVNNNVNGSTLESARELARVLGVDHRIEALQLAVDGGVGIGLGDCWDVLAAPQASGSLTSSRPLFNGCGKAWWPWQKALRLGRPVTLEFSHVGRAAP